jgi:hypothetical protein
VPPRSAPEPVCPRCGAPFFDRHPAGLIEAMHQFDCPILSAEDHTRWADYDRVVRSGRRSFRRPPTSAELALMTARGCCTPGITSVTYTFPDNVRRRSWPAASHSSTERT